MVFPLIPIAAGAGAGMASGWLFSKGKKDEQVITEQHAPYEIYQPTTTTSTLEVYAPQVQYAPQLTYGYQGGDIVISSPGAQTKKEQTQEQESKPAQKGTWDLPQIIRIEPSYDTDTGVRTAEGTDFTTIAIIAAVGLVAYGWLSKK